jgi:hypothetical protein
MTCGAEPDDNAAVEAIALLSETFQSHTKLVAPLEDENVARTGVAWTIRVLRTAEAIVELHRLALGDTAAPLVRSVMEHSISMLWLVERRAEAVLAINYGHRQHQRRLRESATAHGWDLSGLDKEIVHAPLDHPMVKPEDWARFEHFEQRMKDPTIRSWYTAYRVESSLSHASYLSGAIYIREDRGFQWEGIVPPTPLRATAVFTVMAVQALNELLGSSGRLVDSVERATGLLGMESTTN